MASYFLYGLIFSLTWCFYSQKSLPSKPFSFILWAIGLSSTGTLLLLEDSFLPHERGSTHPSSHKFLLSSDLRFALVLFSGRFFLLVIPEWWSVSLILMSSIPSAQLVHHVICVYLRSVCLYKRSNPWFALCDIIKSGLSLSTLPVTGDQPTEHRYYSG